MIFLMSTSSCPINQLFKPFLSLFLFRSCQSSWSPCVIQAYQRYFWCTPTTLILGFEISYILTRSNITLGKWSVSAFMSAHGALDTESTAFCNISCTNDCCFRSFYYWGPSFLLLDLWPFKVFTTSILNLLCFWIMEQQGQVGANCFFLISNWDKIGPPTPRHSSGHGILSLTHKPHLVASDPGVLA